MLRRSNGKGSQSTFNLLIVVIVIFISLCLRVQSVPATGFSILTHGPKELALLNSTIAHTEGPVSNFWNPALLNELKLNEVEIAVTALIPTSEFKSAETARTTKTLDKTFWLPEGYISHKINDKFALGLGINGTFGLGTFWPGDWEGRYITTEAELTTINVNPNLSWKIPIKKNLIKSLTIAGGIDHLYGDGTLKSKINLSSFGLPDASQQLDADGNAWGYNLGILLGFKNHFSFGASYRSKIDLDLKGDVSIQLPSNSPDLLKVVFPARTSARTTLDLPPQVFVGVAYELPKKVLIEVGGGWEGWSRNKELRVELDQPIANSMVIIQDRDWNDAYLFNMGIKYSRLSWFEISAGYQHGWNPVPDDTFEPSIPAADHDVFGIGLQKTIQFNKSTNDDQKESKKSHWRLSWALTYALTIFDDREKANDIGAVTGFPANGEYDNEIHLISGSLRLDF